MAMKKKISFKMWITILFRGIWQFVCNIFSWKNKTPLWRVLCTILTLCLLAFTCMICYAFYDEVIRRSYYNSSWEARYDSRISPNFKYRNNGFNEGKSYIYDSRTKKKIIKNIDWIAIPEDNDSLIIVAKGDKRGFVNRFTAKVVIPFRYDAAWSFTDGVAGVCEGDSVFFIDHSGSPIHKQKFLRAPDYDSYVYHGNFAAIPVNGKYGLLDRYGNWELPPMYQDIHIGARNMWYVVNNDKWGVVDTIGQFIMPMDFEQVYIHPQNGITVTKVDHSQSRYNYEGKLLDGFVFDDTSHLVYYLNEFDNEGNQKQAVDEMLKYSVNNYYGLMTKQGTPETPPLYSDIEVVTPGVYQCQIPDTFECIMINRKGEKIND